MWKLKDSLSYLSLSSTLLETGSLWFFSAMYARLAHLRGTLLSLAPIPLLDIGVVDAYSCTLLSGPYAVQ